MNPQRPVYLDYNATTPVDPAVGETMRPYLEEEFGNPSSGHAYGRAAREAAARARRQVGDLLGARPEEIVFTVSDARRERLEAALRQAEERCPASFCRRKPIRLAASLATA